MVTAASRVARTAVILVLTACSTPSSEPAPQNPVESPQDGYGVLLAAVAPEATGTDTLKLTLVVFNRSNDALTFQFGSGQRFDFAILDMAGSEIWRWSRGRLFTQALGSETIAPGAELRYGAVYVGDVPNGAYRILGELTARHRPLSATLTMGGE